MRDRFPIKTLREEVTLFIKEKIINGNMKPGDKINELELAEALNISRGPIREALRQLEQEGLVTYKANRGCTVAKLTPEDMHEMYLLRSDLEILAAEVCGGVFSKDTLNDMEYAIEVIEKEARNKNLQKIIEADQQFHEAIVNEAKLPRLAKMWHSMDGANAATYFTMCSMEMINWSTLGKNHQILLKEAKNEDLKALKEQLYYHYICVPDYLKRFSKE